MGVSLQYRMETNPQVALIPTGELRTQRVLSADSAPTRPPLYNYSAIVYSSDGLFFDIAQVLSFLPLYC